MATSATDTVTIGLKAALEIGAATATSYVQGDLSNVGNVWNVTPSFDCDEVDVTPIDSTGHSVFIAGRRSATLTFEMSFDQQNTIKNMMAQQWKDGGTNYYNIVLPNSLGTSFASHWGVRAFITSFAPGIDPSDRHGASVSLRLTGEPTMPTS